MIKKRINKPINKEKIKIKDAKDVAKLLMNELKYEKREVIKVILLNLCYNSINKEIYKRKNEDDCCSKF